MTCAPSEDSDQPGHASLRCPHEALCPCLSIERTTNAQADLSLRWAHMSSCWFCRAVAHLVNSVFSRTNLYCSFALTEIFHFRCIKYV